MSWRCEKNHRCKGSLEAGVSVRYNANRFHYTGSDIISGWSLWHRAFDLEYDCYNEYMISKITHCPYCGIRLEE